MDQRKKKPYANFMNNHPLWTKFLGVFFPNNNITIFFGTSKKKTQRPSNRRNLFELFIDVNQKKGKKNETIQYLSIQFASLPFFFLLYEANNNNGIEHNGVSNNNNNQQQKKQEFQFYIL